MSDVLPEHKNPQIVYAGTYGGGLFKSTDAGTSWMHVSTHSGLTGLNVLALAIDPETPANVYAGTTTGIFKSTTGGASWIDTGISASSLAIDPVNPQIVYAGNGCGVYKSTEGGLSWTLLHRTGCDCPGSSGGCGGGYTPEMLVDPVDPKIVYTTVDMSTDGGQTWNRTGVRYGSPPCETGTRLLYVRSMAMDPFDHRTTYFGGVCLSSPVCTVYKSTDGGVSWCGFGSNIPPAYSLAVSPADSRIVYAQTNTKGIFVTGEGVPGKLIPAELLLLLSPDE